jgi:GNAT superfamily N-acetyltransferase
MAVKAYTLRERPDLEADYDRLADLGWPRFMRQHELLGLGAFWPSLFTTWADFQFALYDDHGTVAAIGHSVPFVWDGTANDLPPSLAALLRRAAEDRTTGRPPTALSALAALVAPERRRAGLSRRVLETMMFYARVHGLSALVAPVRPTLKERYPLTPMERYVCWTEGGEPFDPWIRVHVRLGARMVKVIPEAMVIAGTVAAWEDWTTMKFPETGEYVVPGALRPVVIDRERDRGRYADPNVWMHHPVP